jgi:hypothetical protein
VEGPSPLSKDPFFDSVPSAETRVPDRPLPRAFGSIRHPQAFQRAGRSAVVYSYLGRKEGTNHETVSYAIRHRRYSTVAHT